MSYQVLARKWRPKGFDTLVGQEHVVRALTHALDTGRLHHAYLFTGTRGVGKTTIARILAKALNCETGVTSTPCGVCSSCQEIDAGRFVDLLEVDAATNTRVDEMRQLLENAVYAPTRGRFKVYVIDEVHMLSNSAFNAMLKTLEEPPEHIKFILATTDPQKIPVTVLSRCLQFNLKQMPPGHIVEHLSRILETEAVPFDPPALRHIAKGASGSMRDALSLLDQAIAHGAGKVEEAGVQAMLGSVGEDHLFEILDGLISNDVSAMLAVAEAMDARSLSFDAALQALASLLQRIAVFQFAPSSIVDEVERARLQPYVDAFDPEFLQLAYQIAIHGRDELPLAPDEPAGFVMTLLRLHAFRPAQAAPLAGGGGSVPALAARTPVHAGPADRRQADLPLLPSCLFLKHHRIHTLGQDRTGKDTQRMAGGYMSLIRRAGGGPAPGHRQFERAISHEGLPGEGPAIDGDIVESGNVRSRHERCREDAPARHGERNPFDAGDRAHALAQPSPCLRHGHEIRIVIEAVGDTHDGNAPAGAALSSAIPAMAATSSISKTGMSMLTG